jgi:hypothetical protein
MRKYQDAERSLRLSFDEDAELNENQRTSFSNLGWSMLLQGKESEIYFERGLSPNHTPEQWQYHWRMLGLELSRYLVGGVRDQALEHLHKLGAILGANHDRVEIAQAHFDRVDQLKHK